MPACSSSKCCVVVLLEIAAVIFEIWVGVHGWMNEWYLQCLRIIYGHIYEQQDCGSLLDLLELLSRLLFNNRMMCVTCGHCVCFSRDCNYSSHASYGACSERILCLALWCWGWGLHETGLGFWFSRWLFIHNLGWWELSTLLKVQIREVVLSNTEPMSSGILLKLVLHNDSRFAPAIPFDTCIFLLALLCQVWAINGLHLPEGVIPLAQPENIHSMVKEGRFVSLVHWCDFTI